MKPKAIVFDLDNVLSITERKHSQAKIRVLENWIGEPTSLNVHEVTEKYAGISSEVFYKEKFEEHGLEFTEQDCSEAASQKREMVQKLILEEGIEEVPGAIELVKNLRDAGYPLSIASSSPMNHIENVVKALELEEYFKQYTSAKEVGVGKPDPAVYELAAERLQLNPEYCLAIEDSPNGIKSAVRAGMVCIGFGNHSEDSPAHYVTNSLETVSVDKIESVYNEARN